MTTLSLSLERVHDSLWLRDVPLTTHEHVYEQKPEAGWLSLPELTRDELEQTHRVSLHRGAGAEPVASALVLPARHALLLRASGFDATALRDSAWVTNVQLAAGCERLLPALLYCAGRRARMFGAVTLLGAVRDLDGWESRCVGLTRVPRGVTPGFELGAQRMDVWMHRAYRRMTAAGDAPDTRLFANEVAETIRRWVRSGGEWSFFRALRERRLAREQYVYTLSNLYQFVRHTTRLIGRAIGHSADPELRRHWIGHLNGEINHEVIIERDLAHLGEDVEYVMRHMPPNARTQEFMAIQESAIAYYADPVLMMASPLAAEAVTAHLDQRFVDDLLACVASWGVSEPARACKFLTSHMNTDGGEDGHWRMSIEALPRLIRDESQLSLFLTTNASSRRAMEGVWSSCVDETALWARG
jgi:hypothetical protein